MAVWAKTEAILEFGKTGTTFKVGLADVGYKDTGLLTELSVSGDGGDTWTFVTEFDDEDLGDFARWLTDLAAGN